MRRSGKWFATAVGLGAALAVGFGTVPIPFAAIAPARADAATATVGSVAGFAAGAELRYESDADFTRDMDAMAATGAKWIRFDFDWPSIQSGGPASFDWGQTDRMVLGARAHGMQVLGTADYTPTWARPASCTYTDKCAPASAATYANFVHQAAFRYGAGSTVTVGGIALRGTVEAWEIWNEPNQGQWWEPAPSLDAYTRLLQQASTAIKSADRFATVVTGGTAPAGDATDGSEISPATWLSGLYARGAKGSFDAVGHHPYSFPTDPLSAASWNAFTQTQTLHAIMASNGDGAKKIWGTEAGAPTGTAVPGQEITEAQQSQSVLHAYYGWTQGFGAFSGPLLIHMHRDSGTNPADIEDNFGLLRNNWTPKPAYTEFSSLMSLHTVTLPPAWSPWEGLGGSVTSSPAAASWGSNRVDVFARSTAGTLEHRAWTPTGWTGWEDLGGGLLADPAVVSTGPNLLDVFVVGLDQQLWHRAWRNGWLPWQPLGGILTSAPSVASSSPNVIDLLVRGADGALWYRSFLNGVPGGWMSLGGLLLNGPATVSTTSGRLDVFVRGLDNALWHLDRQTTWSGWTSLGGMLTASPAVASWGPGRLDVFVRGTDAQLWHTFSDGTRWYPYQGMGGAMSGPPAAASWGSGRLDVFVTGGDAQVWHTSWAQ